MRNHLKSLEVWNYRAFSHLAIHGLSDVNVVVGRNNVGKTALFESLILLGEPCFVEDSVVLNEIRGLKKYGGDTVETWSLHFHNRNLEDPIVVKATDAENQIRTLRLRLGQAVDLFLERNDRNAEADAMPRYSALLQQKVVRFEYEGPDGEEGWAVAAVIGGELRVLGSSPLPPQFVAAFPSPWRALANVPTQYSELVVAGKEEQIHAAVQRVFPEVTRLVQLTRAGEPTLFASVDDGTLLPIQLLGDGATRVIGWIISLLGMRDKLFVIDEIDNGLHYSVMELAFETLFSLAKQRDVQIFATTHSYEVIEAINRAQKAILIDSPTVKVIRLDRLEGKVVTVDYDAELLDMAVAMRSEVR